MEWELRFKQPSEKIEMIAHKGECHYCGGIVKMPRNSETQALEPDKCWCLRCGQHYYVETDNIQEWELNQWRQKSELG